MTSSHSAVSYQPITDIEFSGLHLIEASAGTGKTFTLSSLMVRIFLEKYLPNQVIATTFTRAAAAELKTRIRLRLQDMYRDLQAYRGLTEQEVLAQAKQQTDPLMQHVLPHFATRMDYACERLKLVLDQLDELFVGTLDSFSQKLLREFAFESGKIERAQITDDAKRYTRQLIHDVLREWIQAQPQALIDGLYNIGALKSVDAFVDVVENSLNFTSAQFQSAPMPVLNWEVLTQFQSFIQHSDLSDLQAYYELDGEYYTCINGTSFRNGAFHDLFTVHLPQLAQVLAGENVLQIFDAPLVSAREAAFKFLDKFEQGKIFKKCPAEVSDGFYHHPLIQQWVEIIRHLGNIQDQLEQLQQYLKAYLCLEVKQRLPQLLQQKGETTFSQQIRTLAEALQGEQGQRFAIFVQARYPLILVDEFQDTNQDQDDMLASIWRHPQRYQKGCMIMVGDRKQAIYGFRGGDMLTFLKAHQDIKAKQGREYQLSFNHRSVKELVEVVDHLFQQQPDFGEQVIYDPIQAGSRPHPALIDQGQPNVAPLRWLMLSDKSKEAEQVAWKIRALLNQSQTGDLYLQAEQAQLLIEDDIAVLSRNHAGLDAVQSALEYLGIRVHRPSRKSVFDHPIAQDVAALLTAVLHPYDEAKIKRALLSRLIGLNLKQLVEEEQTTEGLSTYIAAFDHLRELWLQQGFLSAWQACMNQFNVWQNLVAQHSKDHERDVVNLRHLSEILSQHSEHYQGAQNLYHWYLKQLQAPSQRDWEMERKLSSDAGIQLMTIHQSKGLEFKIVFLLGADKPFKDQNTALNFSTINVAHPENGQVTTQRVIAIQDKQRLSPEALAQNEQRSRAEQNRLWYVALTRASHRVYALMQDQQQKSLDALAFWKYQHGNFQHPFSFDEQELAECPPPFKAKITEPKLNLQAQPLPTQRFYARGKTSFSYLAQHLKPHQIASDQLAAQDQKLEQAADEQGHLIVERSTLTQPIHWIQHNFPKGTLAGNFLHEIFEHVDFQDQTEWITEIRRRFKNDYGSLWDQLYSIYQQDFPENEQNESQLYQWLADWLKQVLTTPLHQGFQLHQLQAGQFLSECPFYLALSDRVLAMRRIQQLFLEYQIEMPDFLEAHAARYLNGSIDLMYFDGSQFHIADYKSNYLGKDLNDYRADAIQQNMRQSSYWLQAALYLVALHRYLKVKLQHYQIEQHLGGATYLYLRGMNGQADQGYYYWRPDTEFILRLDAILGYFD
ncbi:UvrD-helicase domain-containing protein [Acinetobacter ursingii]|uniref:UvrD-helicase domain-containing protein n=1 Tax=Acinetobacter ursingii TaxID=108980 RepID=UPI00124CCAA9|nr:UvrD-helicase domain-containing protein [Acinetobacter ursingii]MCU4305790.1 UvrD-helicase domain-containing protein [Acinetobacter ursingii]MCU4372701.1 UvrD-helicase domain-containing protein [Acinetobacter ursingii]MCU4381421.1 UvrD-helicase domain-containing protein [Acinetobacter ursingii]MDG9992020.1 UvrD-helicase domain-containing protein [Acinetobacter ursingii]MDH0203969.1 UvrD-helicase domain-containing protein [Acinetobacter ursingii]